MLEELTAETACYLGTDNKKIEILKCDIQLGNVEGGVWKMAILVLVLTIPVYLFIDRILKKRFIDYKGFKRVIVYILSAILTLVLFSLTLGVFIYY